MHRSSVRSLRGNVKSFFGEVADLGLRGLGLKVQAFGFKVRVEGEGFCERFGK